MKNKIKWFDNPYNLAEESQTTGIIFSFVSVDNTQCHPWVKCRDFLQDAICATLTKKPITIYGFKFDTEKPETPPVCMESMRMLVSKQDLLDIANGSEPTSGLLEFDIKMKHAVKLLNHYENLAGETLSKVTKQRDGTKWYWLFEGPAFWLKSPALVSMYSYLIRLGDKKIKFKGTRDLHKKFQKLIASDKAHDKDVQYLKVCWNKMYFVAKGAKKILIEGGEFDKDYFIEITTSELHNKGGIKSLCSNPCIYINEAKAVLIFKGVV